MNKVHCDLCDEIIKGSTIQDMFLCLFDWYEFKNVSVIEGSVPYLIRSKLNICEECYGEFKEFVQRKRSYTKEKK